MDVADAHSVGCGHSVRTPCVSTILVSPLGEHTFYSVIFLCSFYLPCNFLLSKSEVNLHFFIKRASFQLF